MIIKKTKERKMKKLLFWVACVLLVLGVFTACDKASSNATSKVQTVDFSEHETFTAWLYAIQNDFFTTYADNPVIRYVGNKFNVTLEFQHPAAGTDADSLALMLGTGEYTDMIDMTTYTGSLPELFNDGVIVDLVPYLDYMPNFKKRLEDTDFRRMCYDDEGRILALRRIASNEFVAWGGLVYRRDILATMTGGNIQFPSGEESPATIEDWDYMLPLFKAYFEAAGAKEYAPLIIPYSGVFGFSELLTGFGASFDYFADGDTIRFGPLEEGFYTYLKKMKEWYAKGYIYKDFASRVNDLFFLPNTALTYGGMTGIWYGFASTFGDAMSMPEYGLYFDVQPLPSPLDTANGISEAAQYQIGPYYDDTSRWVVTSACKNIPKLLSVLDYLYSDEGGMLKGYGLTKEQGADADPVYIKAGLVEGSYHLENGKVIFNPLISKAGAGGTLDIGDFQEQRLPGYYDATVELYSDDEGTKKADQYWNAYKNAQYRKLPSALYYPPAEDKLIADNRPRINDYITANVPKFIMGTIPLDDTAWESFKNQLRAYGADENLRITQAAYERYLKR
jgi:hypothetical protein